MAIIVVCVVKISKKTNRSEQCVKKLKSTDSSLSTRLWWGNVWHFQYFLWCQTFII